MYSEEVTIFIARNSYTGAMVALSKPPPTVSPSIASYTSKSFDMLSTSQMAATFLH